MLKILQCEVIINIFFTIKGFSNFIILMHYAGYVGTNETTLSLAWGQAADYFNFKKFT